MRKKRIVVTGASGFVGRHLAKQLLNQGHVVLALTRSKEGAALISKGAKVHITDYNKADLVQILQGYDYLIHLAGRRSTRQDSPDDVAVFVTITAKVMENLLYAAQINNFKKIVTVSSIAVYSTGNIAPYSENDIPIPLNAYGLSKLLQEKMANLWSLKQAIPAIHLRLAACYGVGEKLTPALMRFITQASKKETLRVNKAGLYKIDQLYITDAIRAIGCAIDSTVDGTFNIGSGKGYMIREIAEMANYVFDNKDNILVEGTSSNASSEPERHMDISRSHQFLGWAPIMSLQEGMQDMQKTMQKNIFEQRNTL